MNKKFVHPCWIRQEIVLQRLATFEETMPIYKRMMTVARDINHKAGPKCRLKS